ncbi:hypothetical protein L218DRAFT_1082454 [Marasmius fiardii PR-910]|nr:hypothetical protein L218DRAFT_1082454 [Marasmius fiardii PR-910]
MITLYDLGPCIFEPKSMGMSHYARPIRFTLNYKNLPYTVIEINYSDVTSTAKRIGAPPTSKNPDGSDKYTVPIIQDSSTGNIISDSFLIVLYLEATYPSAPRLIPEGTEVLQSAFCKAVVEKSMLILDVILRPAFVERKLSDEVKETLRKSYGEGAVKVLLSPEKQEETWREFKRCFVDAMEQGYKGREPSTKVYVMGGESPTYGDLFLAGQLVYISLVFGWESKEWKGVAELLDGRIGKVMKDVLDVCDAPSA